MPTPDLITGLVLAGGAARRLDGRDKGLVELDGRPLAAYVIDTLRPQVESVVISANRNLEQYRQFGWPVLEDRISGFAGPLAGVAAGLAAAQTPWLLACPCDTPNVPPDLASRLADALTAAGADIAIAADAGRLQPLHALIPVALAADLETYLASGERSVRGWLARHRVASARFEHGDPFANANTADELTRLSALLKAADKRG